MRLPEKFENTMRSLLGEESAAFFATYSQPRTSGLRLNGLKIGLEEYEARFRPSGEGAFGGLERLQRIPWAQGGVYTDEQDRPGKHLHYYLGLYYVQEPSAMLPAELLDVRPGHRVLDLCAAPGGKSTQLAAKLQGRGLLVTNDNAAERTKALAKNVERAGTTNALVTNEEPAALAAAFGGFFDRVLVDAPCSGEGMFRKDEDMIREWEKHSVERCSLMQKDILREAAKLVAPGGKLLYSTCTFSPAENEASIARFLSENPEFKVVPVQAPAEWGLAPGRPDWLAVEERFGLDEERIASLAGTVRVWPHRARGEGHYAALLVRRSEGEAAEPAAVRKAGEEWEFPLLIGQPGAGKKPLKSSPGGKRTPGRGEPPRGKTPSKSASAADEDPREKLLAFARETLPGWRPEGMLRARGEQLYLQPDALPELGRLNWVRPGLLLGSATKHRFEPSQALAMGLRMEEASRSLRLRSGEDEALKYMKGETLQPEPDRIVGPDGEPAAGRGWTLVCIDGFPAGWGRWDGTILKNELLPGWRWI
ncbi:RsmB/NOP family class I SAM-dependent RNA methyltransferase [Cohnella thailandensis]|uniref:RsmF rRNA methyltransferase first C-terminal domain-containing protein n=1 Tax=Cohnella thailandensis TaxID=557557 RepID=A0A841SWL3_9BACL|nr:RsmB/NOP family class I SAM-dependent RNA methyltransferase [Cohnella thailandensis]MBB6634017.1 RsmF rRNA methyltransferase first C-terminal domain-containing protein [Cohnella thailandensis]MBP1972702.1 NOL1/NOP2/sun family putative RNA methylase [Cohnella thailandensis]